MTGDVVTPERGPCSSGDGLAACLAVFGTASEVGKSIVVTALCRIFRDLGFEVSPFKAQNMSNNSFVTLEGGEIGRAQVAQAEAARVEAHVDMNPVLLKPSADTRSQVVVLGRQVGEREAGEYFRDTEHLFGQVVSSLKRLRQAYGLVLMEGAGSCAEVNLRGRDFVNFRITHETGAPVVLVADIDRGGVFAQIVGTLEVLPEEDRRRVRGFIINRFRGDASLFQDGISYIERRTGLPVLGLIPYFRHIEIDFEDAVVLEAAADSFAVPAPDVVNVAVLRLPRISNFTDFSPLAREPSVRLHYLCASRSLRGYDLVLLPGTKNVRRDVEWLREMGWEAQLRRHAEAGGRIGGICGGYQALGRVIRDPQGVEGSAGETLGLGLLDVETTLGREKTLRRVTGAWASGRHHVEGYEIHMGSTLLDAGVAPAVVCVSGGSDQEDGARSMEGRIWGTYLHGLFDAPRFRRAFLAELRPDLVPESGDELHESAIAFRDRQYDLLADHFRAHLDIDRVLAIIEAEHASGCNPPGDRA